VKRFSCDVLVELAGAYVDRELDETTGHQVKEHLAACEGCSRYIDQFRATVGLLGDLPPQNLSTPTRNRLMTAFRESRNA
jgi:anti-sigma factor RsiW